MITERERGPPTPASTPGVAGISGGLGLAIVRGPVAAHCGDVAVSNVDDGCRLVVSLPVD